MSELETIERGWDHAAAIDPFFNILTVPGLTRAQFWESGRQEIIAALRELPPHATRSALDFGCGVGRLTQALAGDYLQVHGVDVSSEMIHLANEHNQRPNVSYRHNPASDLRLFEDDTFDLVFSLIVLQHMPRTLASGYVREFLRVTRPGGHVVFQIPEGSTHTHHRSGWLSMWGTPRAEVQSWLEQATVLDVREDGAGGPGITSVRYIVRA